MTAIRMRRFDARALCLACFTSLSCITAAHAASLLPQIYLVPAPTLGGGAQVEAVVTADFDRDGRVDFAVSNDFFNGDNQIQIWFGNALGSFNRRGRGVDAAQASSVVVADFNRDGYPDLAYAGTPQNNADTYRAVVLLNDGRGNFPTRLTFGSHNVFRIAAGDVNGDHNPDLLLQNFSGVDTYLGDGHGNFSAAAQFCCGDFFDFADFDGDGITDMVASQRLDPNAQNIVETLTVHLGSSSGTFGAAMPIAGFTAAYGMTFINADFNGDGRADLLVASGDPIGTVLLGNGHGGFTPMQPLTLPASSVVIGAGDFNGDGRIDVAIGTTRNLPLPTLSLLFTLVESISVAPGDGHGGFGPPQSYGPIVGGTLGGFAAADHNADGRQDLFVAARTTLEFQVPLPNADARRPIGPGYVYVYNGR
ncbi:MAG: putative Ig proteinputative calcium-binding proteinFG-GAP repeat protein [Nevskia sp.]|nr:putative Ig proteinputative calcium-binding proteinFG-GAP repeat protein [Nevskia sp.]